MAKIVLNPPGLQKCLVKISREFCSVFNVFKTPAGVKKQVIYRNACLSAFVCVVSVCNGHRSRLSRVLDVDEHGPQYDQGLGFNSLCYQRNKTQTTSSSTKEGLQRGTYGEQLYGL